LYEDGNVRPALISDVHSIARVHVEASKTTYKGILPDLHLDNFTIEKRERFWADTLTAPEPRRVTLVGFDPGAGVLGFISGGYERSGQLECDGELYAIYILQAAQRRGLGTLLVRRFIRELRGFGFKSMAVWVLGANPFRSFYEKLGGQVIVEQPIERAGQSFVEVAYGWKDLNRF
jgi:GNAT superfamily N-acetyltransferase